MSDNDTELFPVKWSNLEPGDVRRAYSLVSHCSTLDNGGATEVMREARDLNRREALTLAVCYVLIEDVLPGFRTPEGVALLRDRITAWATYEAQAERNEDDDDRI
jgi:hypothetical protein